MAQKSLQQKLKKQFEKARAKAQTDLIKQQRALAMQVRKQQLEAQREQERIQKQERSKYLLEVRFI